MKSVTLAVLLSLCASAHAWNVGAGLANAGAFAQGTRGEQNQQAPRQAYQEPAPRYDYSCISRCANDGRATPYQLCQRQCQY